METRKPYQVIVWGSLSEYNSFARGFDIEIQKGNMHIKAIVFHEEHLVHQLDGVPVVTVEEISKIAFDYLIDMNQNNREVADQILNLLQIPREKVVLARIFNYPQFDFKRWVQVRESNLSILCNNCWGGLTYHAMGLPFLSPFINLSLKDMDFIRLLHHFEEYINLPLEFVGQGRRTQAEHYPIMALGDVPLHFIHYDDVEEAETIWHRRRDRLNMDNTLIAMLLQTPEAIEQFESLPYPYKIAFTALDCHEPDIVSMPTPNPAYYQTVYDHDWQVMMDWAYYDGEICKVYDVLKLLHHEEDYRIGW